MADIDKKEVTVDAQSIIPGKEESKIIDAMDEISIDIAK